MRSTEIEIGRSYWVKPNADSLACKALVVEAADKEPRWFKCISEAGEEYVLFADALIRPVITCFQATPKGAKHGSTIHRSRWLLHD
jgi:hypothetical protein